MYKPSYLSNLLKIKGLSEKDLVKLVLRENKKEPGKSFSVVITEDGKMFSIGRNENRFYVKDAYMVLNIVLGSVSKGAEAVKKLSSLNYTTVSVERLTGPLFKHVTFLLFKDLPDDLSKEKTVVHMGQYINGALGSELLSYACDILPPRRKVLMAKHYEEFDFFASIGGYDIIKQVTFEKMVMRVKSNGDDDNIDDAEE